MARIFITGSSDGIGQHIARNLIAQGHQVTLHARNAARAKDATTGAPGAEGVLIADLSSISAVKKLASDANETGVFDTVIHNAGIGYGEGKKVTEDGIAHVFAVNALAPYILTALMKRPKKLVYLSSGLHTGGDASLKDVAWSTGRRWNGMQAYSDSKLFDVFLAFAVARRWPDVASNAVSPGWVSTKMGGAHAPGSMKKAIELPAWLATHEKEETGSGKYLAAQDGKGLHRKANDVGIQEEFMRICAEISRVDFPG
ncbi:short-chain dehydrogenase/reductase SDR [Stipitochalara longipes BDJ]|nr:short-chain dehydrogenase/reductase SDR [Stipitochalara longipes BDJ]